MQKTEAVPENDKASLLVQLKTDTSFVRLAEANTRVSGILYGTLRSLHNDEERKQRLAEITMLLQKPTQDNIVMAMQKMGFKNSDEFIQLTGELIKRGREVQNRQTLYNVKLEKRLLADAYQAAVPLQTIAYATRWGRIHPMGRAGQEEAQTNGMGDICPNCHYNNCAECASGDTPHPIDNPTGTVEDGGGSGGPVGLGGGTIAPSNPGSGTTTPPPSPARIACINSCADDKTLALDNARVTLSFDVQNDCGGMDYSADFLASCFGSSTPTNECRFTKCAANAYNTFLHSVQLAESASSYCLQGCPP